MASHGNFSIPWNVEAYLADPDVAVMCLAERGLYTTLLYQSWLADDCGLPFSTKKLKYLARCSDEEWSENWPEIKHKFYKEDGRLYNKRLLEEFNKLQARRNNGAQGGRGNTKAKRKLNESKTQSKTRHLEPEPEPELELKTIHTNSRGERVSDIDWKNAGGYDYESIIKKHLEPKDWARSGEFFMWCCDNLNLAESIEIVKGFDDRMDAKSRALKGYTEPRSAGGYLRSEFQKLAERMGVGRLPTDEQARHMRKQNRQ